MKIVIATGKVDLITDLTDNPVEIIGNQQQRM